MKLKGVVAVALLALAGATACAEGPEAEGEAQEAAEAAAAPMAAPGETAELVVEVEGLLDRVKISDAEARVAALVQVSGGRIVRAVLEEEDGRLVYSYDMVVEAKPGVITEVLVDAITGEVVSVEDEKD